jgi:hypothetical protein
VVQFGRVELVPCRARSISQIGEVEEKIVQIIQGTEFQWDFGLLAGLEGFEARDFCQGSTHLVGRMLLFLGRR